MRAVTAAVAVALAAVGTGLGASTASGAPAELTGPPRQVYADGGESYLVDTGRGTVQWLDRETMAPRGAPVELGGPIGRPVVDPAGVLWATVGDSGLVRGVFRDQPARPIRVSGEGQGLRLVLMTGRLVAFDLAEWKIWQVDQNRVRTLYTIPDADRDLAASQVTMPAWTEGSLLPILGAEALIVVDVDQKWSWKAPYDPREVRLQEPQSYGRSIAITDGRQGRLQRIDFKEPRVPSSPASDANIQGHPGHRTVLVRNGGLFVDEVHNPKPR